MKKQSSFHPDHEVAPHRSRCWDGTLGCEQNKPESEFRFHKTLCNSCVTAISSQYGINSSDISTLALLIYADSGLFKLAKYQNAMPDKLEALRRGQEIRIKQLLDSLKSMGGDSKRIESETMAYRKYFLAQAGLNQIKTPVSASHGLPTGDI